MDMKKFMIVFVMAVILGGGLAYFIFSKVVDEDVITKGVAKAFQVGAFTSYDNALRVAERNNGIVVSDDDIYRVYVAILQDDDAIVKLSNYYDDIGLNYYIKEIRVSEDFLSSISGNEELLVNSSSDTYSVINLDVLSKYEEML